jgi:hypothetical protein
MPRASSNTYEKIQIFICWGGPWYGLSTHWIFFTKINWKSREGIIKTVGTNLISFEKWAQKTQEKKTFFLNW